MTGRAWAQRARPGDLRLALAAMVLLLNFAVDLLHGWIDPRLRTRSEA